MPKIVFTHLLNDYSGSPKVLSQVIKTSQQNRYEIELYTGCGRKGFLSNLTDNHHFYFYKRFENKYFTLVTYTVSQLSLFLKLLRFRNEDVIIYINTMLPFGAAIAGKLMGKPVYYHIHETSLSPPSLKKFLRYVIQKTSSKIFFVSHFVKKEEFFFAKKQYVVYNALSDDFVQSAKSGHYQWKTDGVFTVLMICSLKLYKGIIEFVDIAKQCGFNMDVRFVLVINVEQPEIDRFFSKDELSSNLSIISRQTNLVAFYQQASLLLNLSRVDEWVETFGLTIIEAMAFGIPVIVPPVGGPVEIVTEGVEGFLIPSSEKKSIINKIIDLSNDEESCLALSKNAKIRSNHFRQSLFEKEILRGIND